MEKHIILEMKHIVKKYGDFTAVNDVNFSMKREMCIRDRISTAEEPPAESSISSWRKR